MSNGKKIFVTDSACIPTMQKTDGTSTIKRSANIPSMEKAPGSTKPQGGSSSKDSKK